MIAVQEGTKLGGLIMISYVLSDPL